MHIRVVKKESIRISLEEQKYNEIHDKVKRIGEKTNIHRRCRARRRAKVQRRPTRITPYMEIRLTNKLLLMTKEDNLRLILEYRKNTDH